jgi:hypothetical protein
LVKPVHPIEGLPLERLDCLPGAFLSNQLRLVKAVDGLGQCIVVAVAGAAHRRLNACLSEPVAVANGDVPIYQRGLHRYLEGKRHRDQHGWQRKMDGQRLYRKTLALGEVRARLPVLLRQHC